VATLVVNTDEQLTAILAERVMHWRPAPDRYLKPGRSWIPKWRFSPLTNLDDAFQLLERAGARYTLASDTGASVSAEVEIGERKGRASGRSVPRVITIALARAVGVEVDR